MSEDFKCIIDKPPVTDLKSEVWHLKVRLVEVVGFDEEGPNGIRFTIVIPDDL